MSGEFSGTNNIVLDLFPKGEQWYEDRNVCFYAESGYNVLMSEGIVYSEDECDHHVLKVDGSCLGVFTDVDSSEIVAAYVSTPNGTFLVKNPMKKEGCLAGSTNAMRFDEEGNPVLYYRKNGNGWNIARFMKTDKNQGGDLVEVLKIGMDDQFPGIHWIRNIEPIGANYEAGLLGQLIEMLNLLGLLSYDYSKDAIIEAIGNLTLDQQNDPVMVNLLNDVTPLLFDV